MIQAEFFQRGETLEGFCITGHGEMSEGDFTGSLVCAAVSALSQTLAEGLVQVCHVKEEELSFFQESGEMSLRLKQDRHLADPGVQTLLQTLRIGLEGIASNYSDKLQVHNREV